MAQGDLIVFDSSLPNLIKDWDGDSDTWKMGIVDNTTTPTRDTAAPHWGGTGTTNFATNEVGTGGGYTGPLTLSSFAFTEAAANTFRLDFADPATISQNASGFTNGYWAIIFNDTDTNKRALCAIDLGGPISITGGPLVIQFNANGIFQIT